MPMSPNLRPDDTANITVMPLEFLGVAGGNVIESDEPYFSIIFMPQGADPANVRDSELAQVLLSQTAIDQLIVSLQSVRMTISDK